MNQILYEDTGDKKPVDIKKIVLFFSIAVIIFGVILSVIGIIQIVNSKTPVSTNKPVISVEKFDDTQIVLNVTHDKTINQVKYNWNGTEDIIVDASNRKYIERLIEIPNIKDSIINVYVTDSIGIQASYSGTFSIDSSDFGPEITFSQVEEDGKKKIGIRAEDDLEIAYLTYRWNDNEEIKVNATDASSTVIETSIEIPSDLPAGENNLIVVAVDSLNNQSKETQEIKIARKPIIEMPEQHRSKLRIKVTDEVGLDYVQYILNGESFTWRSQADDVKVCETTIELRPGENTIIIKARNKDGIDANTFNGRCIYEVN